MSEYFLNSGSIQCYPTSRRGDGIDPESYILTERNVARFINSVARGHNFIIDKSVTGESGDSVMLECVIGGYFFRFNLTEVEEKTQNWASVYAVIKTGNITLSIGEPDDIVRTDVLLYSSTGGGATTDTILDNNGEFHGLLITDTISDGDIYLVLKDSTINVFDGNFKNQSMAIYEGNVSNEEGNSIEEKFITEELNVNSTGVSLNVNSTGVSLNADWVEYSGDSDTSQYGKIKYYHNGLIHHLEFMQKEEVIDDTSETITLYRWLGFEQLLNLSAEVLEPGQSTTTTKYYDSSINAHIVAMCRDNEYGTTKYDLLKGYFTKMTYSEVKTVLDEIEGFTDCQYKYNTTSFPQGVNMNIILAGYRSSNNILYIYDATAFAVRQMADAPIRLHKSSATGINISSGGSINFTENDVVTDNYINYSGSLLTIK